MRTALSSFYKMYNIAPYPPEVLALQTPEGFEQAFHVLFGSDTYKTRALCYEDLEAEFEHLYGRRKYEDYNSFRNCVAYRHKKRRSGGK
jgi:hypothetical protein